MDRIDDFGSNQYLARQGRQPNTSYRSNNVGRFRWSLNLWYGGDFEQVDGNVLKYAARCTPELKQYLESGKDSAPRIDWLEYDWSLNSKQNATAR